MLAIGPVQTTVQKLLTSTKIWHSYSQTYRLLCFYGPPCIMSTGRELAALSVPCRYQLQQLWTYDLLWPTRGAKKTVWWSEKDD